MEAASWAGGGGVPSGSRSLEPLEPDSMDLMCLPALLAKSQRVEGSKRMYPAGHQGDGLLQNEAYARQFHSAAGSHTGAQSSSSLRVYTTDDRSKLYDGLAGRPHLEAPPRPYDAPRRRFPGAGVSQVDGLLRDDSTPLASEHPSQYGELYQGAAGGPGHWLLLPKPGQPGQPGEAAPSFAGGGPSQMDELLLGRDLDGSVGALSARLRQAEGAAGCRVLGAKAKEGSGRRVVPGGGESKVDELIWGVDVDNSSDPAVLQAKDSLFRGAAGSVVNGKTISVGRRHVEEVPRSSRRQEGRRHNAGRADCIGLLLEGKPEAAPSPLRQGQQLLGRRHLPAGGASLVDDVVLGRDLDGSTQQLAVLEASTGAAGRRSVREEVRKLGRRHIPAGGASRVDDVVLGKDLDGSTQQFAALDQVSAGVAGERHVWNEGRQQGRRHVAGGASRVDEVVLGKDLDGSIQQFAALEEASAGAAGRRSVRGELRQHGRRQVPAGGASRVDDLVLGKDLDGSIQQFAALEQVSAGAAGQRSAGVESRAKGRKHVPEASAFSGVLPGSLA